jgi:arginase
VDNGLVAHVPVPGEPERVSAALQGSEPVYLHIDLDVLDTGEFPELNYPEPGGLTIRQLVESIRGLATFDVIGAGITECVGTGTELRPLLPLLEAVGDLLQ